MYYHLYGSYGKTRKIARGKARKFYQNSLGVRSIGADEIFQCSGEVDMSHELPK
jgi:hypothetical protein